MAICIGIVVNGVEYDPNRLPKEVREEIFNRLLAAVEEAGGIRLVRAD